MPTRRRRALESAIASLEGTEDAVAFASGMGAVYAAMLLDVRAGQRIVAAPDVYGATYAILNRLLPSLGIETIFVDLLDLAALERALDSTRPALVYAETISNPLLRVADLREVAALAHRHDARVAVDNTFATPWLVNPGRARGRFGHPLDHQVSGRAWRCHRRRRSRPRPSGPPRCARSTS